MTNKSDLIAEIMRHEDVARDIASSIGGSGLTYVSADTVEELARTVARLAQATRDALEGITTAGFQR